MIQAAFFATHTRSLAFLRVIVAAYGERVDPRWWRTQFLSPTGLRFAERLFPRTSVASAIVSATRAAGDEHDRRLGVGGRAHLFRLPPRLEDEVRSLLREPAFLAECATALGGDAATLRARLAAFASGRPAPTAMGPVDLGDASRLHEPAVIAEVAAHYCSDGPLQPPYFDLTEDPT